VLHRVDGRCAFHRGGCQIHRKLGHDALPLACQHFPRECLIDARGVSVTLSHYCPTAAGLLFDHSGPVAIVEGPPPIPSGQPEGLDAHEALPPLLRPGMLMDHAGYAAWETHVVCCLAGHDAVACSRQPEQTLAMLEDHAARVSRWRPGDTSLVDEIRRLNGNLTPVTASDPDWAFERRLFDFARSSVVPPDTWPPYPRSANRMWSSGVAEAWHGHSLVIGRYLSGHAFASWMAYQGSGVMSLIRRLQLALAVLRAEAIRRCDGESLTAETLKEGVRQADLLLVHLADRSELARRINAW